MENPRKIESFEPVRNERGWFEYPKSPEFEFWMVRNPSLPQSNLLSADELFVDGILLPLDLVPVLSTTPSESVLAESATCEVSAGSELTAAVSEPASGSRRWKDIFRKTETKASTDSKVESANTNKKRERRTNSVGGGVGLLASSAELNINIWPFSRSRSAGTSSTRPKSVYSTRKVSSAPCSRSNSGGESKSRKWPASPSRAGVHVGRSNAVRQVRRGASSPMPRIASPGQTNAIGKNGIPEGGKGKILKGCKQVVDAATNGGDGGPIRIGSGGSNDGIGVVSLFHLRNLFSKKVVY